MRKPPSEFSWCKADDTFYHTTTGEAWPRARMRKVFSIDELDEIKAHRTVGQPPVQHGDNAEAKAEEAYMIYRGMVHENPPPHWTALTTRDRALYTWLVRYARLEFIK